MCNRYSRLNSDNLELLLSRLRHPIAKIPPACKHSMGRLSAGLAILHSKHARRLSLRTRQVALFVTFVVLWLSSPFAARGDVPTSFPPEPRLDTSKYPACQKDWIGASSAGKTAQLQLIVSCIKKLEAFNQFTLKSFPISVSKFSVAINDEAATFSRSKASGDDQKAFNARVVEELAKFQSIDAQGNYGAGYNDYYECLWNYQADMQTLTDSWNGINNQQG
jgi:hypothetical protein